MRILIVSFEKNLSQGLKFFNGMITVCTMNLLRYLNKEHLLTKQKQSPRSRDALISHRRENIVKTTATQLDNAIKK